MPRCLVSGCALAAALLAGPAAAQEGTPPIGAVLWVGGFAHDFDAFAQTMPRFLGERLPINLEVVRDGAFLDSPDAAALDLIVMNHCFESVEGVLTEAQREKLLAMVRGGVGVVAVHASYYSFRDWPAFRELFGADFTQHGSSDITIGVRATDREHSITRDLPETFAVRSELYESTPLADDCHLLAVARQEGTEAEYPSVWTREYGAGRVAVVLPAHWPEAYENPAFQQLIAAAARWAARSTPPAGTEETP